MKLIIAIIQPSKLEAVKTALTEVEVFRLTVVDVQGFGRQKGQTEVYRGREISVNLLRKVQLQIAVNEEFVEPTVNAIIKGGRTGEHGDTQCGRRGHIADRGDEQSSDTPGRDAAVEVGHTVEEARDKREEHE